MTLPKTWMKSFIGLQWVRLEDAVIILAGGSPGCIRSNDPRFVKRIEVQRESLLAALAGNIVTVRTHNNIRWVLQADLRRWQETRGKQWPIPHDAFQGDVNDAN